MYDYFYETNAEQYSFYRVPKALFMEGRFKKISCEAKILYGLMLDRMGLSIKNHWVDDKNRVYIIFTVEDISDLLGCGNQKAVKLLNELDGKNGIGLIERKRLGLGRPNVIYVKNFSAVNRDKDLDKNCFSQEGEDEIKENEQLPETEGGEAMSECEIKKCENHISGNVIFTNQEVLKSQIKKCDSRNSGSSKIINQEFPKSQSNNTDNSKTDYSDTDYSNTSMQEVYYPSIYSSCLDQEMSEGMKDGLEMIIKRNISYEIFCQRDKETQDQVDEIIALITEVLKLSPENKLRIGGATKAVADVQERFMKLNFFHVEYVLECLNQASESTKIRNIRMYLLTMLYNAPATINNYYANRVIYDMYHPQEGK